MRTFFESRTDKVSKGEELALSFVCCAKGKFENVREKYGGLLISSVPGASGISILTLKAPIKTAADNIYKYFLIVFQR